MNGTQSHPAAQVNIVKLQLFGVGFIVVMGAMMLVVSTAQGGAPRMLYWLGMLFVAGWFFLGGTAWWVPVPIALAFGGLFWVGFRIHMHEAALLLSGLALAPTIAMKSKHLEQDRPALPTYIYLLAIYMALHLFFSLVLVRMHEGSGYGNVVRTYTNMLWAMAFVILFYNYGPSRFIKLAIGLMVAMYVIRISIGVYMYHFPQLLYLPYLNLFFSPQGVYELRRAAIYLIVILFAFLGLQRSPKNKFLTLVVIGTLCWVSTFGGARISVGQIMLAAGLYAALLRKYVAIIVVGAVVIVGTWYFNANTEVLHRMPYLPARAISVLVFTQDTQIHDTYAMSDEWHRLLFRAGWDKWVASPFTFLLGTRIHPFDYDFYAPGVLSLYERVEIAAQTARYEKGLWAVLSSLGLVGGVLYFLAFRFLLKDPAISLWNNRVCDLPHLIYFIAVVHVCLWVAFSWIAGTFPSHELVLAALAKAVYVDQQKKLDTAAKPAPFHAITPLLRNKLPAR